MSVSQPLTKTVYNLKASSTYQFKYFCVNQLGLISDGILKSFSTADNGVFFILLGIFNENNFILLIAINLFTSK